MAKKMRRLLAVLLALTLCFGTFASPAKAMGFGGWGDFGGNTSDNRGDNNDRDNNDRDNNDRDNNDRDNNDREESNYYEWYQVIVNGTTVASATGGSGNILWLGQTYRAGASISGETMTWWINPNGGNSGSFGGSVDISNYVSIPDGYEVAEGGYSVSAQSVTGTNSMPEQYDNCVITVTITALYNPTTGETVPVTEPPATEPDPTEPDPTDPPVTEPPVTEPPVTEPPAPVDYEPALSVVKTAGKASYKEGETITWTITVKNTSEYTAYNVAVSDALTGDSWSIASLAPGAEQIFTATLENAPAGIVKNVVVTSWDDGDEIPDEEEPEEPKTTTDEEIVEVEEPVNYTPVLSIVKTADKAAYETGETITWTITVKNISEYTAYNVAITDELTGDSWSIASLAPGAEKTFTATTENAAAGSVKNVAVATWEDGDEIPDAEEPNEIKTVSDEEIVGIEDPAPENYIPVLSVVKTADKATYKEGEAITWTITVKNVSEYPAYNVVIVDELAKGYWTIESLAPGAEKTFTATMENVAAGSVKNVVVTTWEDGDDIPEEDEPNEIKETSDEEVVTVEEPVNYTPVLSVVKTADKATYVKGQLITWTITVKNISEYTAYYVVVVDELTGDEWNIESLAPGAEQTFTATTKTNKAAAGSIQNVVVVTWEDGDEIDDTDEPEEPKSTTDDETVTVKNPTIIPEDPDPTDPTDPTEPENTPVALDDEIEIPDEEVPLADAPKTGDISILWIALSGISAGGMILLGKKREDDEE